MVKNVLISARTVKNFSMVKNQRLDKAPGQRSPCPAFEPRTLDFFDFSLFSFFMELPLACESSHEYSTSIFIGRGFVRGGCMFSRNIFSARVEHLASTCTLTSVDRSCWHLYSRTADQRSSTAILQRHASFQSPHQSCPHPEPANHGSG